MRVVHLSCVIPPQIGGIGHVAAAEVASLKERGIDAELLSVPAIWKYGNAAIAKPAALKALVQNADIVHLHYPFYGTAEAVAWLRKMGRVKKLILTLHMDAHARGFHGVIFDLHRALAQSAMLGSADALLVSSLDYARHSSFASFADRVIELPFGVDENVFHPADAPSSSRTILFVGGMDSAHAFKGVDVLLKALTKLPQDVRCTLVGDGNLRASYEALASELKLQDRVTFPGKLSQEALADAYRSAEVFAFPSTSQAEAFGLVALEAQSSGIPVVGSDLPGVRTVIANGETGFLVPPNDADALAQRLAYVLDHPEVRHAMGRRARERVLQRFTWSKHIDGLLKVYTDVCASRS